MTAKRSILSAFANSVTSSVQPVTVRFGAKSVSPNPGRSGAMMRMPSRDAILSEGVPEGENQASHEKRRQVFRLDLRILHNRAVGHHEARGSR